MQRLDQLANLVLKDDRVRIEAALAERCRASPGKNTMNACQPGRAWGLAMESPALQFAERHRVPGLASPDPYHPTARAFEGLWRLPRCGWRACLPA